MSFSLPTISATTPLAKLFNEYTKGLAPVAEAVAPRLTLRMQGFASGKDEQFCAAGLFYWAHITAAALDALHQAYTGAEAALSTALAERATPEELHLAAAPFFAVPESVDERIGSASADDWPTAKELADFAYARARAAGLLRFGRPRPKTVAAPVDAKLRRVLTRGQEVAATFLAADTAADFERVLKALRATLHQN